MVCETSGRVRPLLVNRRGGFLDDPFFQDAWDDYHNAVRRIVDRFNHGFFNNPRDRLRDSQYHSMYRTLRSARNNVTQQSAKFKDEGDYYKLVMDVHEFVGGEVTVRTSGGCVSVRGRLEEGGPAGGDADSESSKTSNISNKTLHRRFTLPPDADGEKVVSTLSKDAVLTVTIPKRSDVRVIPVTFEKDTSSDASLGRSGIKRHSITQHELGPTPSKRTQEKREHSISPNRQKRGSNSPDKDKKRENKNRKNSNGEVNIEIVHEDMGRKKDRRRKKKDEESSQASIVDEDEVLERRERRRKSVNERNKQVNEHIQNSEKRSSGQGIRQGSNDDILDEEEKLGTSSYQQENKGDLNSRRKSDSQVSKRKNEKRRSEGEVREFNIPIHFEGESDSSNQVNASQNTNMDAKDNSCNGLAQNERINNTQFINSKELQEEVPISKISETSSKNDQKQRKLPTFTYKNIEGLKTEKENIKPSYKDPPWVYSTVYQDDTDTKVSGEIPSKIVENAPLSNKSGPDEIQPSKNHKNDLSSSDLKITDVLKRIKEKNIKICKDATEISDEIDRNERLKSFSYDKQNDIKLPKEESTNENFVNNESHFQRNPSLDSPKSREQMHTHIDKESPNNSPKNLESPDESQSRQGLSTNESPKIGRIIPIENKQDHQEEDMFKDCWKNFSSTLQDVLARLQELSSDLGESRLMTSTEDGGQNQNTSAENKAREQRAGSVATTPSVPEEVGGSGVGVSGAPTMLGQPTEPGPGTRTPPTSAGHRAVYATTRSTPPRSGGGGPPPQPTNASTHDDRAGWPGTDGAHGQAVGQDTSPQVAPFKLSDGVPDVPRWRGGGGGVTTEPRPRPASVALQPLVDSSSSVSASPRPRPRPTSLLLQEQLPVHTPQESVINDVSQEAQSFNGPRPVRPTSLNGIPGGSLINSLRKGSPVEALKDSFLTRITSPSAAATTTTTSSEGASTGVYIPVEYDRGEAVTASRPLTGDTCGTFPEDIQQCKVGYPLQRVPYVSSDTQTFTGVPQARASLYSLDTEKDSEQRTHPCVRPVPDLYTGGGSTRPPTQNQPPSPPTRAGPGGAHQASPTNDAAVDDLLAKAQRVIEETRKLTQSGFGPSDTVNDLSTDSRRRGAPTSEPYGLSQRTEDRSSPECNILTEEFDSENYKQEQKDYSAYDHLKSELGKRESSGSGAALSGSDQGRQSRARHTDHLRREGRGRAASSGAAVTHVQGQSQVHSEGRDVTDTTELHQDSVNTTAEIGSLSGDVTMGCAKRGVSGGGTATTTPPQVEPSEHTGRPRQTRSAAPRTSRAGDQQGTSKPRDLAGPMGGSFSIGRARTTSPAARTARGTPSSSPASSPAGTFTARAAQRLHEGSSSGTREEKPPPPFARPPQSTKVDSTKRYSGFGNIGSGNVGKMRDLWGSRQEKSKPPTPATTPPFVRKASGLESPRSPRKTTPRATTPTRDSPKPRVDSPGPRASPSRRGSTSSTRAASPGPTSGRRRGSSGNTANESVPRTHAPASSTSQTKPTERRRDSQSSPDKYSDRRRDSQSSPDKYSPGRGQGGHYSSKKAPKERSEPREPPQATTFHQKLFKKLRDSSLQPDSETICFKESDGKYKLVMDVEPYVPGEVEVLQDEKVLTVKGRVELATSDGGSTIRTFHRTFHIPNSAKEEDIDSALSKDGYLTVFVPKKRERVIKIELTD